MDWSSGASKLGEEGRGETQKEEGLSMCPITTGMGSTIIKTSVTLPIVKMRERCMVNISKDREVSHETTKIVGICQALHLF